MHESMYCPRIVPERTHRTSHVVNHYSAVRALRSIELY